MDKITFCIPSKSNLRYLKTCIPSIRENSSKLREVTGWKPEYTFESMLDEMIEYWINTLKK